MGKLVNIVLPGGRVVAVPEEDARAGTFREQTGEEATQQQAEKVRLEEHSGGLNLLRATAEGFADTATGGAYGKVAPELLGDEFKREMQVTAQEHPYGRLGGEALALLLPTGALGRGAKAAGELTAVGLTERAALGIEAQTGSRLAAKLGEGALMGTQGYIANTNVTGDPVTIEGTVESATIGGILNAGLDKMGAALGRSGKRAAEKVEGIEKYNADVDLVKANEKLFSDSPAYTSVREAYSSLEKTLSEKNAEIDSEIADWAEAVKPNNVRSTINEYQKAKNEVLSEISATPYGRQVKAQQRAQQAAESKFAAQTKAYQKFINDTEKFPKALKGFSQAIKQIEDRAGSATTQEEALAAQLAATAEGLEGGAQLGDLSAQAPKGLAQEAKEFRARLSRIAKQVSGANQQAAGEFGGYDLEAGRWVGNEAPQVASIDQAMAELHALRNDLGKYGFITKPNLPEIPVPPPTTPIPGLEASTEALGHAARTMDSAIGRAKQFAANGNHAEALGELRALEGLRQTPGLGDLPLPEIPPSPRAKIGYKPVKLPATLREFARKTPQDMAELSANLAKFDDGTVTTEFTKLADELGLARNSAGHVLPVDLQAGMQEAFKALDRVKSADAAEAAKGGILSWLKKKSKQGAKYAASRFFDVGGPLGAITRVVGGEAFGAGLDAIDNAVVNGTLMASKKNLELKINRLWSRLETGGPRLQKAAPVVAWLSRGFPSGDPDNEKDIRKQAANRIHDFHAAGGYGNDAAFLALEPLMGHEGDIAGKMHSQIRMALGHMMAATPKDPGLDITAHGSNWLPSHSQAVELAHRIEAVENPIAAIERAIQGEGHPAAAETLWAVYPNLMTAMAQEYAANPREMTYEEGSVVSQLFRVPMTGLQQPLVATALQGLYLPKPEQPQAAATGGGVGGRPAKVSTQVAGSSVSGLIH